MKSFKAGKFVSQGTYKSFQPELINRKWTVDNMELMNLLSQADRQLGRLDMYSEYIPNIDLFIRMHVLKEATSSSKIEGTRTNIQEALLEESDISSEKRDDWQEVQNYVKAQNLAIEDLKTLPFSSRLIKRAHGVLLQGVRGKHKLPGEYRKSQNWIGGATLADATFIPPAHTSVNDLMSDIEKFANNSELPIPDLLKIGLIHYQFETVHPFLDGNGRVGRLLIPLYLIEKGVLKRPVLYLSSYLEKHKLLYYDNLMKARLSDDIVQWLKFFLVGIIESAKSGVQAFDKILKLKEEIEQKCQALGSRSANALMTVEHLYQNPLVTAQSVATVANVSTPTAYTLISLLEKMNVLEEVTGAKRGKLYAFKRYINLFR